MTETIFSRLMKLNRINFEQYKNYSSKFDCKIQRYVDFIAKNIDIVLRLMALSYINIY